ncbi:17543_t:CDS:1, partial [Cetraspora pellucida]
TARTRSHDRSRIVECPLHKNDDLRFRIRRPSHQFQIPSRDGSETLGKQTIDVW